MDDRQQRVGNLQVQIFGPDWTDPRLILNRQAHHDEQANDDGNYWGVGTAFASEQGVIPSKTEFNPSSRDVPRSVPAHIIPWRRHATVTAYGIPRLRGVRLPRIVRVSASLIERGGSSRARLLPRSHGVFTAGFDTRSLTV
jgi:hypothetical protein